MNVDWWTEENIKTLPEDMKLGKGAFGQVIVYEDVVDGGTYACKVIDLTKAKHETRFNLKMIIEEVKLLQRLQHLHVVRYFGYEFKGPNHEMYTKNPTQASIATFDCSGPYTETSDTDFLIIKMELCSTSLKTTLESDVYIEHKEKYLVLEQLSQALCFIHSKNVIHRDIKPANILVNLNLNSDTRKIECVKLADFGLAMINEVNKVKAREIGTPKYMSPEIRKTNIYCEKTDVFSAGLVFLEVLIGRMFAGQAELLQIVNKKEAWIAYNLNSEAIKLVKGMLNDNVHERLDAESVLKYVKKLAMGNSFSVSASDEADLEESPSGFPELDDYIWMDIREEVEHFEGRKKERIELTKCLKTVLNREKGGGKKLILIHGLGGIGKTELAVKFMNCWKGRVNGVWLRGENETSLRTSISKLASELKLNIKDEDTGNKSALQLLQEVSAKIVESGTPWGFVVDNVDKDHKLSIETTSLLQSTQNTFVLVTSQCPLANRDLGMTLSLESLASGDAQEFVKNAVGLVEVNEDIQRLCSLLGNLPLALQQAVAHIKVQKLGSLKGNGYGVADYITEYNESVEQQKTLLNVTLTKEEQTVYNTINTALNKIRFVSKRSEPSLSFPRWLVQTFLETIGWIYAEEPPPIRILFYLAYMDSDSIPVHILEAYMNEICKEWTPELVKDSLLELKSRSIIQCEFNIIRVHRVVQTIMRISDAELDKEKPPYLCELSIASCSLLDSKKYNKDHLQQAVVIWNAVKERKEVLERDKIREMPGKIARQMLILIQYIDALKHTEEALPIMEELFGKTDPRTALKMKRWRGCALGHSKDLTKSLEILKETADGMSVALGEDDDDTLNVNDSRAMILKDNNKLKEAEEVHRRCIELYAKKSGKPMSSKVAAFTQNMGMTLIELWKRDKDESKIDEAIKNYESVYDWCKSTHGENHPDTLDALGNLAFGYYEKGDKDSLETAKKYYKEVDRLSRTVLGDEHSNTLVVNVYWARVLKGLGQSEESKALFSNLLEPLKRVIGPEHHFYREAASELGLEVPENQDTMLRL